MACPGEGCGKVFAVEFRGNTNVRDQQFREKQFRVLKEHLGSEWDPCKDPDRLRMFLSNLNEEPSNNVRNNLERK